jgi:hypothetical protein
LASAPPPPAWLAEICRPHHELEAASSQHLPQPDCLCFSTGYNCQFGCNHRTGRARGLNRL